MREAGVAEELKAMRDRAEGAEKEGKVRSGMLFDEDVREGSECDDSNVTVTVSSIR